MGFRNGDGNEESPEVEKIELPSDEPNTKVSLEEPEDDGEDEGEQEERQPKVGDQPRKKNGTWAERKKERGQDRKAAKAWEAERADYDRRFQRIQEDTDRTVRQMREEIDRLKASSGNNRQADPLDARLDDIDRQLKQELKLIENDPNRGYDDYNRLRREEQKLISLQALREARAEEQRMQQSRPRDPYAARGPILESEFPWILDSNYRELAQRARTYKNYLVDVERKPDTIETDREALSHVQAHFGGEYGMRPPPAPPSPRTRSLYAPPPSRGVPRQQEEEREVDLGVMGQGHGLDPKILGRVVREAIRGK